MFWILLVSAVIFFIANCFFKRPTKYFMEESSTFNNMIIFLLASKLLSSQIFSLKISLPKNPLFIIGCAACMFCAIFTFCRILYLLKGKTGFNTFLFDIFRYVNAVTYLLFTWAFVCIAREILSRKKSISPQRT
ncbi:MAG: hypothetical protein V4722_14440 [Bacteroidota bacterium]